MKSFERFDRAHWSPTVLDRLTCHDTSSIVPYNPDYIVPGTGSTVSDLQQAGYSGADISALLSPDAAYAPGYTPVVPDTTFLDLPGQLNGIPGGGASGGSVSASDPSGINMVHTSPGVNPTPTGGYLQSLAQIAAAASQSFSTFVKGSPSVATPAAKKPTTGTIGGALSLTTPTGGTNWLVIGGALAVVAVGVFIVVKYA